MKPIDYSYAHDLLRRMNTIHVNGKHIQDYFMLDGYNYWQAYQAELFTHAKRFSSDPRRALDVVQRSGRTDVLFALVSFCASALGLVCCFISRRKVGIYGIDKKPHGTYRSDFRQHELYEALIKTDTPFVEILETTSSRDIIRHFVARRRCALYTNGFDLLWVLSQKGEGVNESSFEKLGTWHSEMDITDAERCFIDAILRSLFHRLCVSAARVHYFKRIFGMLGIRTLFAIDDMRNYFDVLVAAHSTDIHTIAIQHGHYTKYHVGAIPFSDDVHGKIIQPTFLYVWTEYWKNELARLGTYFDQHTIIVAGVRNGISLVPPHEKTNAPRGVLVPFETDVDKEKMMRYISAITSASHVKLYFKPRPDLKVEEQLRAYGMNSKQNVEIVNGEVLLENVSYAIGTYTSFLYDCIISGIAVLIALDVSDYGEGMVKNGLATPITSPEMVCEMVKGDPDQDLLAERRTKLLGTTPRLLIETLTFDIESRR